MRIEFAFLCILLSLLAGCTRSVPSPTMGEIQGATFNGLDRGMKTLTLSDGIWEADSSTRKDGARSKVVLEKDFILGTDLDSNGIGEAVVVLTETFGGSGTFIYMAIVTKSDTGLVNPGTELLGDRIQVRRLSARDGLLQLDYVEQAPADPMCCPGQLVTKYWILTPKGLVLESLRSPGRLTPAIIAESEWELERWDRNDPAGYGPPVTLSYEDGRFIGSSGCNRYFAPVTAGQVPGDITIGRIGGTRMTCPDSAMAMETRFLSALAAVNRFGFHNGRLALTTLQDSVISTMLFRRKGG
jgi:heat shock protein HslJ